MSSKTESIFAKRNLMKTSAGLQMIMKSASRSGRQAKQYLDKSKEELPQFAKRFVTSLFEEIKKDKNPSSTLEKFASKIGFEEIGELGKNIDDVRNHLLDLNVLQYLTEKILNTNFIKMTYPLFSALMEGKIKYSGLSIPQEDALAVLDGTLIEIDLSETIDRIVDKDEDLDYLDDFRLMCPYIYMVGYKKIARGGETSISKFEKGLQQALEGQKIDYKLKLNPRSINEELMHECYKKYRAIMGTAGDLMALDDEKIGNIYYHGMARAGESVGCGNEIEDSIRDRKIKIPSWPLYFALKTLDSKRAFELTMDISENYLLKAKNAHDLLPESFPVRPFIGYSFLIVSHYNQTQYQNLKKADIKTDIFEEFQKQIVELTRPNKN